MPEAQIMPSAGDFRGLVVGLYRISTTSRTFHSPTCDDDLTRDRTDENDTDNRQCLPPPRPPRVCDSEIAKNPPPARATRKSANTHSLYRRQAQQALPAGFCCGQGHPPRCKHHPTLNATIEACQRTHHSDGLFPNRSTRTRSARSAPARPSTSRRPSSSRAPLPTPAGASRVSLASMPPRSSSTLSTPRAP